LHDDSDRLLTTGSNAMPHSTFDLSRASAFALALSFMASAAVAGPARDVDAAGNITITLPDIAALKAQATTIARDAVEQSVKLALNDELLASPPSMAFIANEFGNPREIIKNAPYTAEAVTESIQVLPDNNRIVKKSITMLARDGFGRTRQERKGDGRGGVYIYDPMEGRSIVLDESRKTATRIPRVPLPPDPPMAVPGMQPPMPPAAPVPPVPGAGRKDVDMAPGRVTVRRSVRNDGTPGSEDVQVEVIRIGGGEGRAGLPAMPPMAWPMMPRGKGETRSLGSRDIDGVKADGTLTTHTIPAGEIGNEKPINITSERWFSPELHIVVLARTIDPRAGETIYRITNVKRGEPPAELFRVPADYTSRG
jgi:hypothetical protein